MNKSLEKKYLVKEEFQNWDPRSIFVFAETPEEAKGTFLMDIAGINSMNDETYDHYMSEVKISVTTKDDEGEKYWEWAEEEFETLGDKNE